MSRYQVNKAIRYVTNDEEARRAFLANRNEFLMRYDLTQNERDALMSMDYRKLYAYGVHSFLLFRFVMSIIPGDRQLLESQYCEAVASFGRPDYST
jgi:hypothetical protein